MKLESSSKKLVPHALRQFARLVPFVQFKKREKNHVAVILLATLQVEAT